MTTTDPKHSIASFDTLDDAVSALGGYPKWLDPAAIAVPQLDRNARMEADRRLVSTLNSKPGVQLGQRLGPRNRAFE
jgi:hypothetical protein